MGDTFANSMPVYLLNTAFNMIELVDNNTGEIIGNALCYFTQNTEGKLCIMIDNIEIRHNQTPNISTGINIRKAITKYASNIAKEVTGRNDTTIYLGAKYNDVETHDLKATEVYLKFIGGLSANYTYSDVFHGNIYEEAQSTVNVYDVTNDFIN